MHCFQTLVWRVSLLFVILLSQASVAEFDAVAELAELDSVDNIRLWHSPNNTRIVFDVSSDVRQSMFTLQNPLRLVVDIQNAQLKNQLPKLDPQNEHILQIRSGTPQAGILRFVFELKKDLLPSNFVLSPNELYGHRLVIDLNERLAPAPRPSVATPTTTPDSQAQRNARREPQPIVLESPVQQKKLIVAIDAGHGGEDPGASGYRGSQEKKITLSISKRLQKRVNNDPNMSAVLIRTGDYYIKLHQRRLMARNQGADIFISIHADAFIRRSARGFSVFALSQRGATSAMASALAVKENASDRIGGVSLADKDAVLAQVLVDLSMTNTISESVNLGGRVLRELGKLGKLHSTRVEQAGFAVLKSPDMPSILVETGFITNPEEERLLRTSKYQEKIANAIYTAINEYYQQTPYFNNATYASPSLAPAKNNRRDDKTSPAYHLVKSGDSLSKISAQYNVTIRSLKRLNKLKNNTVFVGQKVKLPAGAKQSPTKRNIVHKVKRGDNLSELAARYGVTINAIMKRNKLKKPTIYIGQSIRIP